MTRHEAREQAFVLVFENIFNPEMTVGEIIDAAGESADIVTPNEFSVSLAETVFENKARADEIIEAYARGWKVTRLAKVSLAILRLAICELMTSADTPQSVIINEAVELAKTYATEKEASYINGILGAYVRAGKEE